MKDIQGYVAMIPNDPSGRGLLYFNVDGAKAHKATMDSLIENEWETGKVFDKGYWTEKPQPVKIFELVIGKEIT